MVTQTTVQAHTPAPWKMYELRDGRIKVVELVGDIAICEFNSVEWGLPQAKANALLTAAAPELLEACKRLLTVINGSNFDTADSNLNKKRSFAEAALNKAEGRS